MNRKIALRCDAGSIPEIGTGHLRRCLLLAASLKKRNADLVFLTTSPSVVQACAVATHPVVLLKDERAETAADAVRAEKAEIVLWDRLDTNVETVSGIKATGALFISLDDAGPGQALADITINAMVAGGDTTYKGLEYAILPPNAPSANGRARPRITVSFGGYDHGDVTRKTVRALRGLSGDVEVESIVGSGYEDVDDLRELTAGDARFSVVQAPADFTTRLANSDVAIVSGGLTLLEAAANGVACLAVAQYGHQEKTIQRLAAEGAVIDLGRAADVREDHILQEAKRLLGDADLRRQLQNTGRALIKGHGLDIVTELLTVVDQLSWDTNFFGVPIAYLYPRRLNENLVRYAFDKCRESGISCLYYLCDCHDPKSVKLAEQAGFHFVDMRLSFSRKITEADAAHPERQAHFDLRAAVPSDVPALRAIAAKSYVDSRYYFDRHFPLERCEQFYSDWIAKCVLEGYSDVVFVADRKGVALGYIACSVRGGTGVITLIGVAGHAGSTGIGKSLVRRGLAWFAERGVKTSEVVTQGRNYGAQRLYQGCGYKTQKTELWYHKWFDRD